MFSKSIKVPMQRKIQFKINLISKNLRDIYDWNLQLFFTSLRFGDIAVCLICKLSYLLKNYECWMIQVHRTQLCMFGD